MPEKNPNVTEDGLKDHIDEVCDYEKYVADDDEDDSITGEQIRNSTGDKPIPFLVESLLQRVGLACLAGSSDTGKSCLLRQLAIDVCTGEDAFIGFKLNSVYKSAIYVATEDGRDATGFLLHQQSKQFPAALLRQLRFVFDYQDLYKELKDKLRKKAADIVIIDCFQDAYGGDLKDSQKIRTFLHPYQALAEQHQCLFLFLHHTGKRTENFEPSKNNLLSGQGFEAKMRLVAELRADLMHPAHRHLCIVKGNYLSTAVKRESHVLNFDESSFTFTNTGERQPFEFLVKTEGGEKGDNGKSKYLCALELKQKGYSHHQIAEVMGYNSKGSVSALFAKGRSKGWGKEEKDETSEFE